ncbi:MAG TPA: VOC family protein [Caulobacteraceae bacterium]|jgi:hypothetical protein|nr:VOC family protein [Caulobacteraceae bacterium]
MRLRQIALAVSDLESTAKALNTAFGLGIAYRDPAIIHYGLANALLPVGGEFIEVLTPVRDDVTAARFLARHGDAGYMLIFQVGDAERERARIAAMGVRVVDDLDRPSYRAAHFHPKDFGGILCSVDQQRTVRDHLDPYGDWQPAGRSWRDTGSGKVTGLKAAVLASPDPAALASRFSALLDRPLDASDALRLPLDRGELRFVAGDEPRTSLSAIELTLADASLGGREARIGGVRFKAVG